MLSQLAFARMGFLDKLRGGSDITLSVNAEPIEVGPGGQVTVRFDVGGELDDKCRGIRVGLQGTASYKAKVSRRDNDGNVTTTEEWQSYELHGEEHGYPAQIGPGQATFTIPANAPPSSGGAVRWQVSAVVDRERGRDKVERTELSVRHGAEGLPTARAPQQFEDGLTLDDVPVAVRAGDTLSGHLTVNTSKDVSVTAVRIRLHRKVTYTAAATNDGSLFAGGDTLGYYVFAGSNQIKEESKAAEIDLSGKREFSAGSVEQLPFSIEVPNNGTATTAHNFARVEWRLEAVLDRRMRDDLAVDTPLIVF